VQNIESFAKHANDPVHRVHAKNQERTGEQNPKTKVVPALMPMLKVCWGWRIKCWNRGRSGFF
jgi:hypothetical protein